MVYVVKTSWDVAFDKPRGGSPIDGYVAERRVASTSCTETMGVGAELRFILGFQEGAYDFWQ